MLLLPFASGNGPRVAFIPGFAPSNALVAIGTKTQNQVCLSPKPRLVPESEAIHSRVPVRAVLVARLPSPPAPAPGAQLSTQTSAPARLLLNRLYRGEALGGQAVSWALISSSCQGRPGMALGPGQSLPAAQGLPGVPGPASLTASSESPASGSSSHWHHWHTARRPRPPRNLPPGFNKPPQLSVPLVLGGQRSLKVRLLWPLGVPSPGHRFLRPSALAGNHRWSLTPGRTRLTPGAGSSFGNLLARLTTRAAQLSPRANGTRCRV